ncbi:MAG: tryptophan halogenase family protein [Pacificimonas sp.]
MKPLRIVILGGGSAGWMIACLMAQRWLGPDAPRPFEITLVESPQIGIIGVGEGSTPQLKAFFDQLGIAESDWMPACDATYKLGIRFTGWSERLGHDSYFHPFPSPIDLHTQPAFERACALRRSGVDIPAHPDDWFLATRLAREKRSPHPAENFPFTPSYGYHFDAQKVGDFLAAHARSLGVRHSKGRVEQVELSTGGDIAALICARGERMEGDLFVDSSGFRAVIASALGMTFQPFARNLFNDAAVTLPTPAADQPGTPATEATALSNGWAWSIPLTSRTGNGYVYSSRYIDANAAETELRRHLGLEQADIEARHLNMKVGRMTDSWCANCLTVGLSQGFLEPLEATALHVVIATANDFMSAFEAGDYTPQHRARFNAKIGARYENIRDYIVAHYRLNRRTDTDYWRDNAVNDYLSDSLKAMMTAWFTGANIASKVTELDIGGAYSSLSWHCLFAGYGHFPVKTHTPTGKMRGVTEHQTTKELIRRAALSFLS